MGLAVEMAQGWALEQEEGVLYLDWKARLVAVSVHDTKALPQECSSVVPCSLVWQRELMGGKLCWKSE